MCHDLARCCAHPSPGWSGLLLAACEEPWGGVERCWKETKAVAGGGTSGSAGFPWPRGKDGVGALLQLGGLVT